MGPCAMDNGNFLIDAPFPADGVAAEGASSGGVVKGAGMGGRKEIVEALARKWWGHGIFSSRDVKSVVALGWRMGQLRQGRYRKFLTGNERRQNGVLREILSERVFCIIHFGSRGIQTTSVWHIGYFSASVDT